jgi:hypothetical protein
VRVGLSKFFSRIEQYLFDRLIAVDGGFESDDFVEPAHLSELLMDGAGEDNLFATRLFMQTDLNDSAEQRQRQGRIIAASGRQARLNFLT